MRIKKGEVYVWKRDTESYSALVITEVSPDGSVAFFDTGCRSTLHDVRPHSGKIGKGTLENFEKEYQKATKKQINFILTILRDEQKAVGIKIFNLEKYAQSQPKYIPEPLD